MALGGDRVSNALGFHAAAMRDAAVKAGERLLAADLNLQLLRAAEAAAWTRRGKRATRNGDERLLDAVRKKVGEAHRPVREALEAVTQCDGEILGLAATLAGASENLRRAQSAFERERAGIEATAKESPRAVAMDSRAEAYERRAAEAALWAESCQEDCERVVSGFERDPVFAYLVHRGYGPDGGRRSWFPFNVFDRILAKAAKHDEVLASYMAARNYPVDAARWSQECLVAAREARSAAEDERESIRLTLGEARGRLAAHLNRHSEVDGRIVELSARRREAMSTLAAVANGGDAHWKALSDRFSSVLAKSKGAALARPVSLAKADLDLQDGVIDRIAVQRKRLASASDSMRAVLGRCAATERTLEDLRHALSIRQWDRASAEFSMPSIDSFIEDVAEGRLSLGEAWKAIEAARAITMPKAA